MDYVSLGKHIRSARIKRGLTQEQVAEMIQRSTSFYGHIEHGTRKASVETIEFICNALDLSFDELLGRETVNTRIKDHAKKILELALAMAADLE